MSAPCSLTLEPSRRCAALILSLHGAALLALVLLPWPWPVLLGLAAAVLAHAVWLWRRQVSLTAPGALIGLQQIDGADFVLRRADGQELRARLIEAPLNTPMLTILRFALPRAAPRLLSGLLSGLLFRARRRRRALCLFADHADSAALRRLRTRLPLKLDA